MKNRSKERDLRHCREDPRRRGRPCSQARPSRSTFSASRRPCPPPSTGNISEYNIKTLEHNTRKINEKGAVADKPKLNLFLGLFLMLVLLVAMARLPKTNHL